MTKNDILKVVRADFPKDNILVAETTENYICYHNETGSVSEEKSTLYSISISARKLYISGKTLEKLHHNYYRRLHGNN